MKGGGVLLQSFKDGIRLSGWRGAEKMKLCWQSVVDMMSYRDSWNSWKDNLDNNIIKQYSKTHSSKFSNMLTEKCRKKWQ